MDTAVYIDGLNLFYGCLKGTQYKWLNPLMLCERLLAEYNNIIKIKYFCAIVNAHPDDPKRPLRHQIYLRALRTLPNLEVILGKFHVRKRTLPIDNITYSASPAFVDVLVDEERRTDVNISAHMVNDGHKGLYKVAVLVSNDADLLAPVILVKEDLKLKVGLIVPHQYASREMAQNVTFLRKIKQVDLLESQFPDELMDNIGKFHKPAGW